jgi:hypothetical protein
MAQELREYPEYRAWSEAEGYPAEEIPAEEDCPVEASDFPGALGCWEYPAATWGFPESMADSTACRD